MATAIKIYSTDTNQNMVSKTVSNANPAASDYVLKTFSQQLISLSENSFSRAERIDTTDITSATEGGGTSVSGFYVASSSPFFSTDSDTYVAAFDTLTEASGGLVIALRFGQDAGGATMVTVGLDRAKAMGNLTNFINLINYNAFSYLTGDQKLIASQINNGIHFETADVNMAGTIYPVSQIWLMENENGRNENVAAWLKDVGEKLIQVPGYTSTYGNIFQSGNMKGIKIVKIS